MLPPVLEAETNEAMDAHGLAVGGVTAEASTSAVLVFPAVL